MKILMVCLGNICRSPIAEGVLKSIVRRENLDWFVDSAGTSGWHNGELPDPRAISVANDNGIDISDQRSRIFKKEDFELFDLILAMDSSNYKNIIALTDRKDHQAKVRLIMNFAYPDRNIAVPDPYYDGNFQKVFDLISEAGEALITHYKT